MNHHLIQKVEYKNIDSKKMGKGKSLVNFFFFFLELKVSLYGQPATQLIDF